VTNIESMRGTLHIGPSIEAGSARPGPAEMAADDGGYNVATIRQLLFAAFTAEELPRFLRDRPLFRPITYRFGPNYGFDDMVNEVIEYVSEQFLWEELLAEVEGVSPRQYARFAAQLRAEPPGAGATAPPAADGALDGLLRDLHRRVRDYASDDVQDEARAQVAALDDALQGPAPDLEALESAWCWFDETLPALSLPMLNVVHHVRRRLEAGDDDALLADFRRRFSDI
jgi:hypothetical protein